MLADLGLVPKFVLQPFNAQRLEEFARAWFGENEAAEHFLREVRNVSISRGVKDLFWPQLLSTPGGGTLSTAR